jgi:hypothetical protein
MKCLKCDNDALAGKALCAECFARHQSRAETVGSDEWTERKLKETRLKATERRNARTGGPSLQSDLQNVFLRVAPIIICIGGFVIFFSWFVNSGGFRLVRTSKKAAVAQPTGGANDMGTSGMQEIADKTIKEAELVPTPSDSEASNDGYSAPVEVPTETPIDTPTATPTDTPTDTPTATPTI